ncbi:MAG TPA: hypothetical protein VGQ99_20045 [Tepidisphaeraceae bacterium]|jgi:hypothetical protein|nr:hypothetical protein [Tepidisphaeraceae bacterium]
MPELEPPKKTPDPKDKSGQTESPDPIKKLHKMSTTAGVGSQDYVAINNAAIVSVILGLCTALAFLGVPFLVIGAAGIVSGVIALLQIRHSNGTQGGSALAILGILLSLVLAGSVAASSFLEWNRQRDDERDIDKVLEQLGQYIAAEQYDKAYQLFSPDFQMAIRPDVFRVQLQAYQQYFGKIDGMTSNDLFQFATTQGIQTAQTQAIVRFQQPTTKSTTQPVATLERRVPTGLYKLNGQWRIAGMEIFRKPGQ